MPELEKYTAPSFTTIKRWMQKVGYYKLMKPKPIANDWMVLIDASIQMGEKKCLLVVGCRREALIKIVSSLNAKVVTQALQEVTLSIGKIMGVCTDQGSEMIKGVKDYQISNPGTRHVADTAHRIANFLEATLEKSEIWKKFREQVTQARRKMQNSLVSGALPPSPRTKSRFMNVDSLIEWSSDMLLLLENGISTPEIDINELKKYLGWLLNYREDIRSWNKIAYIGAIARDCVRTEHIHMGIVDSFEQSIALIKIGPREMQFVDQISLFLLKQSENMKFGEYFIGSTESLESIFGKVKYMEKEQTAFGFTSLVLAAIACVGTTDEQTIADAIKSIKHSDIDKWAAKEIGRSVQSERRKFKTIIAELKKKMEPEVSGILQEKVMGF
jgi:hypothetical protein